jgi:hypothetical protein
MATTDEQKDQKAEADGQKDAAYWEAEAKKAFAERDKAKKSAKDLEGRVLSDEQAARYKELEEREAKAEDERKRKAGEFDQWRESITKKHATEIDAEKQRVGAVTQRYHESLVRSEFGAATAFFGGHDTSKTILDVELGMAALGKYVKVEETEQGDRVIVKSPSGQTILGKDGNPAPFADAIGELIALLPNKDRILRGSGKSGSGSSGGASGSTGQLDLTRLTPADFRKPEVREALRQRQANAGGLQIGPAWDRRKSS